MSINFRPRPCVKLTRPVRGERRLANDRLETTSRADTYCYEHICKASELGPT